MQTSSVLCLWRNAKATNRFRSGVSLHSHTNQSRESLRFLAMVGERYWLMRRLMRRLEHRAEANHGMSVDYKRSYWTPPLPPKLALELEAGQIEKLGLAPMVSLSDHDNIKAPLSLQTVGARHGSPISVEWSVPFGPQSFHLGIHNLPIAMAGEWMETLAAYTARPCKSQLREILSALHAIPQVLIVFNHPIWDLYRVGEGEHAKLLNKFLRANRDWIHAIELNGLRSWDENREAMCLAAKWNFVLISGGDRHAIEPNANINMTNAETFEEFVDEIRVQKRSTVLMMPQYAQPWSRRILQSSTAVVGYYPHFPRGSQRWDERVYHPDANGVPQRLSDLWPDGNPPRAMRWGVSLVQLMGRSVFSGVVPVATGETHGLAIPLE